MADSICYKCGAALPSGSVKCPNCGAPAPLSDSEIRRSANIRPATIIPPVRKPSAPAAAAAAEYSGVTRPLSPADIATTDSATRPLSASDIAASDSATRPISAPAPPPLPIMPAPQKAVPHNAPAASRPDTDIDNARPQFVNTKPKPSGTSRNPDRRAKPGAKTSSRKSDTKALPWGVLATLAAIAVMALGVYWLFSDGDSVVSAETAYAVADTPLRNSNIDVGNANTVATVPYGASVDILETDGDWLKVSYRPASGGKKKEGYIHRNNVVSEPDIRLLSGIFAPSSAEAMPYAHQRLAMLNYFRANGYIGDTDPYGTTDSAVTGNGRKWRFRSSAVAPCDVYSARIFNPDSRYEDFAFIVHSAEGLPNRLIFYSFDDNGTPIFRTEREVGNHHIISAITADNTSSDGIAVQFLL